MHGFHTILGDPGADNRGERQIKRAKTVRAEAWWERKFTRRAETAPGRIPLMEKFKSPFVFLLLIEHKFWGIVFFVPNQRSVYFTVPFVTSYRV